MTTTFPYNDLERSLAKVETGFNIAGYVPIVSSMTAPFRASYGKVEIIAALVCATYKFAEGAVTASGESFRESMRIANMAGHGLANIGRSVVELIPFINLLALLYDLIGLRITYLGEEQLAELDICI